MASRTLKTGKQARAFAKKTTGKDPGSMKKVANAKGSKAVSTFRSKGGGGG